MTYLPQDRFENLTALTTQLKSNPMTTAWTCTLVHAILVNVHVYHPQAASAHAFLCLNFYFHLCIGGKTCECLLSKTIVLDGKLTWGISRCTDSTRSVNAHQPPRAQSCVQNFESLLPSIKGLTSQIMTETTISIFYISKQSRAGCSLVYQEAIRCGTGASDAKLAVHLPGLQTT